MIFNEIQVYIASLLAAFSLCQGGKTYMTVSILPAHRQPHSVWGAFAHANIICLFLDPYTFAWSARFFKYAHELECMCTQTRALFNVTYELRGNTDIEPRPFLWEVMVLTTRLLCLVGTKNVHEYE